MHIKIKNKKIEIKEYQDIKQRLKSLRFVLEPIDYGIQIKSKWINTYFFCQKIDICITDKNDNIIRLYEKVNSEKIRFISNAYTIYYLPLNTCKNLKLQEKFTPKE